MDNLISGGFLIVRATPRGEHMKLLPKELRSGSECLSHQFPHPALIGWAESTDAEKIEYLKQIGLKPDLAKDAEEWCTANAGKTFGWQNVFYDLDTARQAKERFFKDDPKISILGLGILGEYAKPYIEFAAATLERPGEDEPFGKSGTLETLEKNESLPEGGNLLGYDLYSTEDQGMIYHSHLCLGWENDFAEIGVKPNKNGLISDPDSARKCLEVLRGHAEEEPTIEHAFWSVWAVIEYK